MHLDHPPASPSDRLPLHGIRLADPWSEPKAQVDRTGTCPGQVRWLVPDRGARDCIRVPGHGGDHEDAAGHHWNDQRWSD